jgi:hypothetical protein
MDFDQIIAGLRSNPIDIHAVDAAVDWIETAFHELGGQWITIVTMARETGQAAPLPLGIPMPLDPEIRDIVIGKLRTWNVVYRPQPLMETAITYMQNLIRVSQAAESIITDLSANVP